MINKDCQIIVEYGLKLLNSLDDEAIEVQDRVDSREQDKHTKEANR